MRLQWVKMCKAYSKCSVAIAGTIAVAISIITSSPMHLGFSPAYDIRLTLWYWSNCRIPLDLSLSFCEMERKNLSCCHFSRIQQQNERKSKMIFNPHGEFPSRVLPILLPPPSLYPFIWLSSLKVILLCTQLV